MDWQCVKIAHWKGHLQANTDSPMWLDLRVKSRLVRRVWRKEPHPFHVKPNWIPPVQPSIALESYRRKMSN